MIIPSNKKYFWIDLSGFQYENQFGLGETSSIITEIFEFIECRHDVYPCMEVDSRGSDVCNVVVIV